MGKIQDAQREVERIEGEIEDLRQQFWARRRELASLASSLDPEAVGRAGVLEKVIERLQARLPIPGANAKLGDYMTPLQHQLVKAQDGLENVRRERYNLAKSIEREEEKREKLARLPEIGQALDALFEICGEARIWPLGMDDDTLRRARNWVRNTQYQLSIVLPNLQERLEAFGPDPDYRLPDTTFKEIEAAIVSDRRRAAASAGALGYKPLDAAA